MDLRIVTCIYGREEITKAFLHHLEYLRQETSLELPLSVAYSTDEDGELLDDVDHIVRIENKPIGRKWNELIKAVLADTKDTHYIGVGSDDFLNVEYLEHLTQEYDGQKHHVGVNKFLIYSPMHKRLVEHTFNNPVFKLTGGGRMVSYEAARKVFEKTNLYAPDLNGGLDNNSELALRNAGYKPTLIDFDGYAFVDVKSLENIHKFEEFQNDADVAMSILDEIMPNVEIK